MPPAVRRRLLSVTGATVAHLGAVAWAYVRTGDEPAALVLLLVGVGIGGMLAVDVRRDAVVAAEAEEARLLRELADQPPPGTDPLDDLHRLADLSRDRMGAVGVAVVATAPTPRVLHAGGRDPDRVLADAATPPPRVLVARADAGGLGAVVALAYPAPGRRLHRYATELLRAFAGRAAVAAQRTAVEDERRRAALLEATDHERAALLSGVSHDLRTPLAVIKASAGALASPDLPDAERAKLAGSIAAESDRLDRMVRNLLALSRIEAGRLVARPEPMPVDELIGSVLTRLRPALRGRRLELDVPAELPLVRADPVQVEQVIGNLVENVVAHTPLNAGLIVRAARRGDRVTIRVADEGPGIPPGDRARIFERFGRGRGAGPGSGLGLAVARAYAEANGGALDLVDSDCGAAFELRLQPVEVRP